MSKRTLFLIFALFLITFVLLMMALYQPQASKVIQSVIPTPKAPVAQTVLSFGNLSTATSSSPLRQSADLNYSVPINISSGKNQVTAVQLEMQYDPAILTNVVVTTGSFFPKPDVLLNQVDSKTGRISYAFGVGLSGQGIAGQGTAATLNFSVKAGTAQKTAIIFLPKTLVTAQGVNESVLKEANVVGQFTVGESNSAPPLPNQ